MTAPNSFVSMLSARSLARSESKHIVAMHLLHPDSTGFGQTGQGCTVRQHIVQPIPHMAAQVEGIVGCSAAGPHPATGRHDRAHTGAHVGVQPISWPGR